MSNPQSRHGDFSAAAALRRLAGFGAAGAAIAGVHLVFGIGLPCPLLSLTEIQCPFCGSTRAAGALVRGDIAAAWSYNALLMVVIPVLAVAAVVWTVELAGGPKLRPPAVVRPLTQTKVYLVVGLIAVVFMVVRNLV